MFVITRVGIAAVAYISAPLIADSPSPPYHFRPDHLILDVFGSRWDTGFYLSIAEEGYKFYGERLPSVAFFPLLPLIIRAMSVLVGDPLIAGLMVTNAALLLAVVLLHRLVSEDWGGSCADRATWYLLIFPTSFFGSAIYSESLFLLGAVGAFYFARKGYWESAAMLGFLAALTRLMGLILAPMLLAEWISQRRQRSDQVRPPAFGLLSAVAVPLGTLAYMLYLQQAFGDPLAFVRASAAWERAPRSPINSVATLFQQTIDGGGSAFLSGNLPLNNWIDFALALFFLLLGFVWIPQRRWSEGVYVILGSLIPLSSGLLMSQRRYVWVLFPAFILLARWGENIWVDRIVVSVSLLGLGIFTAMFANGYWVG